MSGISSTYTPPTHWLAAHIGYLAERDWRIATVLLIDTSALAAAASCVFLSPAKIASSRLFVRVQACHLSEQQLKKISVIFSLTATIATAFVANTALTCALNMRVTVGWRLVASALAALPQLYLFKMTSVK